MIASLVVVRSRPGSMLPACWSRGPFPWISRGDLRGATTPSTFRVPEDPSCHAISAAALGAPNRARFAGRSRGHRGHAAERAWL